ncbi:MAG TPA: hypothetical protein DEF72_04245 [Gammaproteobacteria bacterium]|nr:hypothetical protein [Gammaproteobacteria bacterium]
MVVLVGAPGQGKTAIVEALILRGPVNSLRLEGEFLGDRTDVVLRMAGLTGLRPEGTNIDMLARLQSKKFHGFEYGVPEVIVDDSHHLQDDVLQLFQELTVGAYGRRWSILLVGEDQLVSRLQSLKPLRCMPSIVRLPLWDQQDLEQAVNDLQLYAEISDLASRMLRQHASQPRQLLQAINETDRRDLTNLQGGRIKYRWNKIRLTTAWLIASGMVFVALLGIFVFVQMGAENGVAYPQTIIPLAPNK